MSPACKPDASIDSVEGVNAGQFTADIACAATKPLKAAGDSITIGLQNPQGDPNGSFPEYSSAVQAAVKYINEELGGIGSDLSAGKAGRPIKLETCFMAINPEPRKLFDVGQWAMVAPASCSRWHSLSDK